MQLPSTKPTVSPRQRVRRISARPRTRSRRVLPLTTSINGSCHEDQVGRPMIRYLLEAYTAEQIDEMFDKEQSRASSESSPTENDEASILPESESQDALPHHASGGSPRSPSESSAYGSCQHNASQQAEEEISMTTQTASAPTCQPLAVKNVAQRGSGPGKKLLFCCLCAEYKVTSRATRPHDLRRHMEEFHAKNNLWFCVQRDCPMTCQFQGACKSHFRTCHPTLRLRIDDVPIIRLCRQTVFACGSDGCEKIFEARSAQEVSAIRREFFEHLIYHYWPVRDPKPWSYSTRVRNLLRQTELIGFWPPAGMSEEDIANLYWEPETTGVVLKQLETRHLGDKDLLVRYIVALGSGPSLEVLLALNQNAQSILGGCPEPLCHMNGLAAPMMPVPPMMATIQTSAPVPMMAPGNGTLLADSSYVDAAHSNYPQQPLLYQAPMQHMTDPITMQPQHQQHNVNDWVRYMQCINFDGGDNNSRLM